MGKINKFLYYGTADADNIISSIPEFDLVADENNNMRIFSHCIDSRMNMWYDICEIILIFVKKEPVS